VFTKVLVTIFSSHIIFCKITSILSPYLQHSQQIENPGKYANYKCRFKLHPAFGENIFFSAKPYFSLSSPGHHFPVQLMCTYLYYSYNCLHIILFSADMVHIIILQCTVKPSTMRMQSGNSSSCSTLSYLVQKGGGKIGQTSKLKVALLSVLQVLVH
jgi:hypothetical protein